MTIAATGFSLLTTSHGSPYWSTPNRQLVPTQLATAIATARATVAGSLALSLAGILGLGLDSPAAASPTGSYRLSLTTTRQLTTTTSTTSFPAWLIRV